MKNRGSLYQSQSLIETIENLKKEIGAKSQIIDEHSGRLGNMTKEMDDNINLFKKSIKEADDKASVAIAEKKNKIDELTKQTEDFRANMEIMKKQKVKLEEAVAGYEERCSDLRHSLHKTSLNESAVKKTVEEKTKCVENFEHEIHNLHMECDAIKENIQRKVDLVETMQQELENEK